MKKVLLKSVLSAVVIFGFSSVFALSVNESELEIFAFELNVAIKEISSISSPFDRDEILDEMFSNFCLGK